MWQAWGPDACFPMPALPPEACWTWECGLPSIGLFISKRTVAPLPRPPTGMRTVQPRRLGDVGCWGPPATCRQRTGTAPHFAEDKPTTQDGDLLQPHEGTEPGLSAISLCPSAPSAPSRTLKPTSSARAHGNHAPRPVPAGGPSAKQDATELPLPKEAPGSASHQVPQAPPRTCVVLAWGSAGDPGGSA